MRQPTPILPSLSIAFLISAITPTSRAQPAAPPPALPGTVPLVLQGDRGGLDYEISLAPESRRGEPRLIATCRGDCTVFVSPGRYRIQVDETPDTVRGRRDIYVQGPTLAEVEPRESADRSMGLAFGVGGSVLFVGGMVAIVAGANDIDWSHDRYSSRTYDHEDRGRTLVLSGLLAMVGGAVMAPIGWVMFARRAPTVTTSPIVPQMAPRPVSVGFVPAPRGGAFGVSFAF